MGEEMQPLCCRGIKTQNLLVFVTCCWKPIGCTSSDHCTQTMTEKTQSEFAGAPGSRGSQTELPARRGGGPEAAQRARPAITIQACPPPALGVPALGAAGGPLSALLPPGALGVAVRGSGSRSKSCTEGFLHHRPSVRVRRPPVRQLVTAGSNCGQHHPPPVSTSHALRPAHPICGRAIPRLPGKASAGAHGGLRGPRWVTPHGLQPPSRCFWTSR